MDQRATFNSFYDMPGLSFGEEPTRQIKEFAVAGQLAGKALDLGAGDGRNTLYLASTGLDVTAVDFSEVGMAKLRRLADQRGLSRKIKAFCSDVRLWTYPADTFDLVVAVTIFDHLPADDIEPLLAKVRGCLRDNGDIFIKVHTIDDPGHVGMKTKASELAAMICHYFDRGELLRMVRDYFQVIAYKEMFEQDNTHGSPHSHAFAQVWARKLP